MTTAVVALTSEDVWQRDGRVAGFVIIVADRDVLKACSRMTATCLATRTLPDVCAYVYVGIYEYIYI